MLIGTGNSLPRCVEPLGRSGFSSLVRPPKEVAFPFLIRLFRELKYVPKMPVCQAVVLKDIGIRVTTRGGWRSRHTGVV